ncbi:MAG: cbb3-type cytochrome c oxidase subunit 3 [Pseudomonadota bacterium]|nr:cbb3-type cytochrome c oxidase subunit 3 [Pseudomonadota bacterium]
MDFIALRSAFTLISFVVFLGIMWWAYSSRQSRGFSEAASIPFHEDEDLSVSMPVSGRTEMSHESKESLP